MNHTDVISSAAEHRSFTFTMKMTPAMRDRMAAAAGEIPLGPWVRELIARRLDEIDARKVSTPNT